MPLKSYTVLQMKIINQPINTVGFWWLVLMGVGRDSLLIWGNLFTLQTLRSTNQPGTLTACVWKFFTAGNFFTKKFVPNFAAPWHGWEFEKGKFPLFFILDQCSAGHLLTLAGKSSPVLHLLLSLVSTTKSRFPPTSSFMQQSAPMENVCQ